MFRSFLFQIVRYLPWCIDARLAGTFEDGRSQDLCPRWGQNSSQNVPVWKFMDFKAQLDSHWKYMAKVQLDSQGFSRIKLPAAPSLCPWNCLPFCVLALTCHLCHGVDNDWTDDSFWADSHFKGDPHWGRLDLTCWVLAIRKKSGSQRAFTLFLLLAYL